MSRALIDISLLAEDLNAAARRRLWLLSQVFQGCPVSDLESAVAGAEFLEHFVVTGQRVSFDEIAKDTAAQARSSLITQVERPPAGTTRSPEKRRPSTLFLDEGSRERFIAEAVKNPDNRHLAGLFGLSVRQAHAVRVAFRRLIAARGGSGGIPTRHTSPRSAERGSAGQESSAGARLGPFGMAQGGSRVEHKVAPIHLEPVRIRTSALKPKRAKNSVEMDREAELRAQAEFLARKPPPVHTMDDVVRFLRQQGDIITRDGDAYRVNYANTLDGEQLVVRANQKRADRGLPSFAIAGLARRDPAERSVTHTAA